MHVLQVTLIGGGSLVALSAPFLARIFLRRNQIPITRWTMLIATLGNELLAGGALCMGAWMGMSEQTVRLVLGVVGPLAIVAGPLVVRMAGLAAPTEPGHDPSADGEATTYGK